MPRLSSHASLKDGRFQSLVFPLMTPVVINAVGNTFLTPAQVLGGWIDRDSTPTGGIVADTLPSAAVLVEAIQGCIAGTVFEIILRNLGGTYNIFLYEGIGGTLDTHSNRIVNTMNARKFLIRFTSVVIGQEAYTLFSEAQGPY